MLKAQRIKEGRIFDVKIHDLDIKHIFCLIERTIENGDKVKIFGVNPSTLNLAYTSKTFKDVLNQGDLTFIDGAGVLIASRLLGLSLRKRLSADMFVPEVLALAESKGYSIFLVGSLDSVLQAAVDRLRSVYPKLSIVGYYAPPYCDLSDLLASQELYENIDRAVPDIVFVGLGSPKQEFWVAENYSKVQAKVFIVVGGYFDKWGGKAPFDPPLARKLWLSWLLRLLHDPRRLWRRYLIGTPLFFYRVLKYEVIAPAVKKGT